MRPFLRWEMARLRALRRAGYSMDYICRYCDQGRERDALVEAVDALRRCESDEAAAAHVNRVLADQSIGIPLVNGRRMTKA